MDFVKATDQLLALGVGLRDLEDPLGLSYSAIRASRLDPESPSYRRPPNRWEEALAKLARERAAELTLLADDLTREAEE